jgi:hypothetical protein
MSETDKPEGRSAGRANSEAAEQANFARSFTRGQSREELSEWLRRGIEEHVRNDGSFRGFAPLEEFFHHDLPVSEGLASIHAKLEPIEQSKLRSALALILDRLHLSEETVATAKEIMYSARRLPAPEIFDCLPKKIKSLRDANGEVSDVASKDVGGRSLFDVGSCPVAWCNSGGVIVMAGRAGHAVMLPRRAA